MIRQLKPTREGAGLQFSGWIARQAQGRFKNNWYEMIGVSKLANRKSR